MNFKQTPLVHVFLKMNKNKIPVGSLGIKNRRIYFEYNLEFINSKLEISPFKLPLKRGIQFDESMTFDGLFGVFNDSLPDGWGRLLIDRKLKSLNINPGDLSPLDRLCYVGSQGMGALIYEPEIKNTYFPTNKSIDDLAYEAYAFIENEDDSFVEDLLIRNGSSAGARPKIISKINGEDWIIKFRSSTDFEDIGPIEYAYHLMASHAKLDVPKAKLFKAKKGPGYFGVKRFDRQDSRHIHMHSISGLIHADHRLPSLDYGTILKVTSWLTKNTIEVEKQFRASIFNILSHNRDDHAKNFSFLMNEEGIWTVSPAYDLNFSSGPFGEHCTMVMKEGKNPTLEHLLKLANLVNIKEKKALEIIKSIKSSIIKWDLFAKEANVSKTSSKIIKQALNNVDKQMNIKI